MNFVEDYLKKYDFTVKRVKKCLIAYNDLKPNIGFIGHTDTVNYESWEGSPFELKEDNGKLIALGACDMKGGVSAILSSVQHGKDFPARMADADRDDRKRHGFFREKRSRWIVVQGPYPADERAL